VEYVECDLQDYRIVHAIMTGGVMASTYAEIPAGMATFYEALRGLFQPRAREAGLKPAEVSLPPGLSKGLPRYPVPAMRVGRLAVDRSVQVKGVGSALLRNALQRAITLSTEVGTCAVLVDAINEQAKSF
jgi:GNAT superfamily N-acetyltransferase